MSSDLRSATVLVRQRRHHQTNGLAASGISPSGAGTTRSESAGGNGATYAMTSSNAPTPRNATTRVNPDNADRSMTNNLITAAASSAAPASQTTRALRRVANTMSASAAVVQVSVSAACSVLEAIMASKSHGTWSQ